MPLYRAPQTAITDLVTTLADKAGRPSAFITNANTVTEAGFYNVGSTWTGSPYAGTDSRNQGYIIHDQWNNVAYSYQQFRNVNAAYVALERRNDNGTWSGWYPIYHARNILGGVAQVSGVPTGGLIERGSNANGEYVRFADGTQICTGAYSGLTIDQPGGTGWYVTGSGVTIVFPITFSAVPSMSAQDSNPIVPTSAAAANAAQGTIAGAYYGALSARAGRWAAIGRWF